MAATFLDRACAKDEGSSNPLDLDLFYSALHVYVAGIIPVNSIEFNLGGLTALERTGLEELLTLMPATAAERPGWVDLLYASFYASRYNFGELDTVAKVRTALGLD